MTTTTQERIRSPHQVVKHHDANEDPESGLFMPPPARKFKTVNVNAILAKARRFKKQLREERQRRDEEQSANAASKDEQSGSPPPKRQKTGKSEDILDETSPSGETKDEARLRHAHEDYIASFRGALDDTERPEVMLHNVEILERKGVMYVRRSLRCVLSSVEDEDITRAAIKVFNDLISINSERHRRRLELIHDVDGFQEWVDRIAMRFLPSMNEDDKAERNLLSHQSEIIGVKEPRTHPLGQSGVINTRRTVPTEAGPSLRSERSDSPDQEDLHGPVGVKSGSYLSKRGCVRSSDSPVLISSSIKGTSSPTGPLDPKGSESTLARQREIEETSTSSVSHRIANDMDLEPMPRSSISSRIRTRDSLALASGTDNRPRPYLTVVDRESVRRWIADKWRGKKVEAAFEDQSLHVDFTLSEARALGVSIQAVLGLSSTTDALSTKEIARLARDTDPAAARRIIDDARARGDGRLAQRQEEDISRFLADARAGGVSEASGSLRVSLGQLTGEKAEEGGESLLSRRHVWADGSVTESSRAAGCGPGRFRLAERKRHVFDTLGPWRRREMEASGDVVAASWHPGGESFALGSAALTDDDNMQYNKPNNLLFGSIGQSQLVELPDHRRSRHRAARGVNATDAIVNTMDSDLYYTVSNVDFSVDGRHMFSSSYDKTVKIWSLEDTHRPSLQKSLRHHEPVDIVSTSSTYSGLLATGRQSSKHGVRVYKFKYDDDLSHTMDEYSSRRAAKDVRSQIWPASLQWGKNTLVTSYLLAGFSSNVELERGKDAKLGDVCVWDVVNGQEFRVTPQAQSIFDCVWHPTLPQFATGCVADSNGNPGVRSYLRLYAWTGKAFQSQIEFECPARDMNDITWCQDEVYATASCTDGKTYVWDSRNYGKVLHTLCHGPSLLELPTDMSREEADTGVKFAQWGESSTCLYTGSSDGVLKQWDIRRASEDALIQDVAHLDAPIMSGKFSPDYSKLLVGDSNGGINVLSVGLHPNEVEEDQLREFDYVPAKARPAHQQVNDPFSEGRHAADEALALGQMRIDTSTSIPQAVQGPNYDGPWSNEVMRLDDSEDEDEGVLHEIFETREVRGKRPKSPRVVIDLTLDDEDDVEMVEDGWHPPATTLKEERSSSSPSPESIDDGSETYEDQYEFDRGLFG